MKLIRYLSLVAWLLCTIAVHGHPKPSIEEDTYHLTVIADPSDGCSVSGGGNYAVGAEVYLRCTAGTGFVFLNWTRDDGTIVSTSANFTYTKQAGDETLTAHFKYDPSSPSDPETPVFPEKEKKDKYTLKLLAEEGGTNLKGSGEYEPTTVVAISVGTQTNYTFVGWYDEKGTEIGTTASFNYTMGEEDVTLTARFNYTPGSPNDPVTPDLPEKPTPKPTHIVTLMATEGGSVSGGGTFEEGTTTTIKASSAANFTFVGWFNSDTLYTEEATFTYTIGELDVVFEARFEYTPGSPGDPDVPVFPEKPKPSHSVTVKATPADGGSVSVGNDWVEEEKSTRLTASPATGFVFTGWYSADTLYSDKATTDYVMGTEDVVFEARFDYNPGSPDDPVMPATDKFSLYLSTVRAMPGRTVQYPVYLNTQDTVCDMHFNLTFPSGTTPDMSNIRLSGKAVGYTLTYELVQPSGVKAFRTPRRAPEGAADSTVYAISLTGGMTPPCNTRLLTVAVTVDESFQGTGNQKVGINQISMTNTTGETETSAARHGSLMMRESSELGLYYYLTIISTGSGTTRVGSKNVRNALQVVEMLEGTSTNVYFTPDNGYHLENVTKDDVDITDQVTNNRLLISDVKDDIQLEVTYAEGASASWPLTITAMGHGSVTYDGTVVQDAEMVFSVTHGAEAVMTITPDNGYHVSALTIDGSDSLAQLAEDGKLTIESVTASKSVVVTFAVNMHTLTFQYGDTVYKQTDVAYGEAITTPENPKLQGYTFVGWIPAVPETMPDSALVFTAQFAINSYLLTYMVDGEVLASDSIAYGSTITPKEEPTKEGHTFSGWSEFPETMPANDVTIEGNFIINSYLLTYMVDGETIASDSIEYNAVITPLTEPTKDGHTFSGWSRIPETMPANDVVVMGSFTPLSEYVDEQGIAYILINGGGYAYSVAGYSDGIINQVRIPDSLFGYNVTAIMDGAFRECTKLKSIVIPETILSAGKDLFLGANNLLSVEWNSPARLSADCFDNPSENGNLLVYANGDTDVRYRGNVIRNGEIGELVIIDGKPMRVTKEFQAGKVSYTREFSKKSPNPFNKEEKQAAGWEGIMLPFDVQKIEHETKGEAKVFWLAKANENDNENENGIGFVKATEMKANVQYIISMPNNERYLDEYNLNGKVTFSAENVSLPPTPSDRGGEEAGAMLVGTTEGKLASGRVYVINDELYAADGKEFMPGGVFVQGLRDVRPFEAYVTFNDNENENGGGAKPRYIPIRPADGKTSDIASLFAGGSSPLHSEGAGEAPVYDLSGRIVATSYDEFARRQSELKHGVYIYKNQKVMIKR